MNNANTLFQSPKLQLLDQIDQYYSEELKSMKFSQFEQMEEQERNTVEFQKIFKKKEKADNAIKQIAHDIALFKKQRNPPKIRFKDTLKQELGLKVSQPPAQLGAQPQQQQQQLMASSLQPPSSMKSSQRSRPDLSEQARECDNESQEGENSLNTPPSSQNGSNGKNPASDIHNLKRFQDQQKLKLMQIIAQSLDELMKKKDFTKINSRQAIDKAILKTGNEAPDDLYISSEQQLDVENEASSSSGDLTPEDNKKLEIDFEDNNEAKQTIRQ